MGKDPHIEVIARGVHVRGGRVLVCRNIEHGYCYLPGGHVEFGEPAAYSLAREFEEECALSARVGPLLLSTEQSFVTGKKRHHEVNLVFLVEHLSGPDGGEPEAVESCEPEIAFEYVDLAAATDLDIRPTEIKAWLAAGGATGGAGTPWVSGIETPTP